MSFPEAQVKKKKSQYEHLCCTWATLFLERAPRGVNVLPQSTYGSQSPVCVNKVSSETLQPCMFMSLVQKRERACSPRVGIALSLHTAPYVIHSCGEPFQFPRAPHNVSCSKLIMVFSVSRDYCQVRHNPILVLNPISL